MALARRPQATTWDPAVTSTRRSHTSLTFLVQSVVGVCCRCCCCHSKTVGQELWGSGGQRGYQKQERTSSAVSRMQWKKALGGTGRSHVAWNRAAVTEKHWAGLDSGSRLVGKSVQQMFDPMARFWLVPVFYNYWYTGKFIIGIYYSRGQTWPSYSLGIICSPLSFQIHFFNILRVVSIKSLVPWGFKDMNIRLNKTSSKISDINGAIKKLYILAEVLVSYQK